MATEDDQVKALQRAIIERANELANGHVEQGKMTRSKIIEDAREKIKLMEQKELLLAKVRSDREYQRQVQASELRIQAELDRNRWGLVQSIMHNIQHELVALHSDAEGYWPIFEFLLKNAASKIQQSDLVASINSDDLSRYAKNWRGIVRDCCGTDVKIELSHEAAICSGGLKLVSKQGDIRMDNTFEGIISRRDEELQRLIFERLFSSASTIGTVSHG